METVVGMGRVAATKAVVVEGTAVKNRAVTSAKNMFR